MILKNNGYCTLIQMNLWHLIYVTFSINTPTAYTQLSFVRSILVNSKFRQLKMKQSPGTNARKLMICVNWILISRQHRLCIWRFNDNRYFQLPHVDCFERSFFLENLQIRRKRSFFQDVNRQCWSDLVL